MVESLVAAAIPCGYDFELFDRVTNLLKAIGVERKGCLAAREHEEGIAFKQHELVAFGEFRKRVQLSLQTLRIGDQALNDA